ncbi:MAG: hypothetical protein COT15_05035 [Candidatus Diapherotrites archaeon CG08_land_8_20_14_0_20_34_12]|nr:MAG: hypothetical protein COT15_05035 [Candidatus Diapherotrites archaeon CG08_land_8_20_14_0_20_34_12]
MSTKPAKVSLLRRTAKRLFTKAGRREAAKTSLAKTEREILNLNLWIESRNSDAKIRYWVGGSPEQLANRKATLSAKEYARYVSEAERNFRAYKLGYIARLNRMETLLSTSRKLRARLGLDPLRH